MKLDELSDDVIFVLESFSIEELANVKKEAVKRKAIKKLEYAIKMLKEEKYQKLLDELNTCSGHDVLNQYEFLDFDEFESLGEVLYFLMKDIKDLI